MNKLKQVQEIKKAINATHGKMLTENQRTMCRRMVSLVKSKQIEQAFAVAREINESLKLHELD